jgi:DNA-directed RNA polymerase II subunit RPB2
MREILDSILEKYIEENGIIPHHLDSFNKFITELVPKLVDSTIIKINDNISFHFENCFIDNPKFCEDDRKDSVLYPFECTKRTIPYNCEVYVDISVCRQTEITTFKHIHICSIPCMVKSAKCNLSKVNNDSEKLFDIKECQEDPGGYFICVSSTNKRVGKKVLITQEKSAPNRPFVFKNKKTNPKFSLYAEEISITSTKSTQFQLGLVERENSINFIEFQCVLPYIDETSMPLQILLKSLGCDQEIQMQDDIILETELTREESLLYIGKKIKKYIDKNEVGKVKKSDQEIIDITENLLHTELFPHLTSKTKSESFFKKTLYIQYILEKLLGAYTKKRDIEDRDHYSNKRATASGFIMFSVFQTAFKKMCKDIKIYYEQFFSKYENIILNSVVFKDCITLALVGCLTKNKIGKKQITSVAQKYEQFNRLSALSILKRITSNIHFEGGKIIAPRQLHETHNEKICIAETPEGKKTGLVKNLTLCANISVGFDYTVLLDIISDYIVSLKNRNSVKTKLLINGDWIGQVKKPKQFVTWLREKRRVCDINPETSIYFDSQNNEIQIHTDSGRVYRPLIILYNGKIKPFNKTSTWSELLSSGVVEYIDTDEEEEMLICIEIRDVNDKKYTHLTIHPSLIFGVCAGVVPFSNHNPSPRITYESSMLKQAIGIPFLNFRQQTVQEFHILAYPQKQITYTTPSKFLKYNDFPSGVNAIVAVCFFQGLNQEDSIVMNKNSVERGLLNSYFYLPFYLEIKEDNICIPDPKLCDKIKGDSSCLEEDGIIYKGAKVEKKTVLIGRMSKINKILVQGKLYTDNSILYDQDIPGIVEEVEIGETGEGYKYIRVVVVQKRDVEIGDKFASINCQKGTVGMLVPQEDLPFTKDGITPDICISPLAFPSRMTIGQLIECLFNKKLCLGDTTIEEHFNADPYPNRDITKACKELSELGYEAMGDELMIDGMTGEELKSLIFIGPLYYQRLKHLVANKIHSRARGPVTALTRQPSEGRSAGGGLRIGVNEKDCICSQGASAFIRDRMFTNSDAYSMTVCNNCGIQTDEFCRLCNKNEISKIDIPYATKLLSQEFMAMNIAMRFIPEIEDVEMEDS